MLKQHYAKVIFDRLHESTDDRKCCYLIDKGNIDHPSPDKRTSIESMPQSQKGHSRFLPLNVYARPTAVASEPSCSYLSMLHQLSAFEQPYDPSVCLW
mmetsp:Transcript_28777/g.60557  ORF Transcript_28777/g.60557 Transcript_28777/m.60557 type:complete len:98 (+) Transcript_28777:1227-1520(+)